MNLKDKIVVITGGASGLGAATAAALISEGAKVALLDIQEDILSDTASRLGATPFICDITDDNSVSDTFSKVHDTLGTPSICINCAGIAPAQKIISKKGMISLDHFRKAIEINLIGTLNCIRHTANYAVNLEPNPDGERGVIINTASIAAFEGQIGQAAYSASKGGVHAMTLPIARELASHGIRVVTIAPGLMETPMLAGLPEEVQESLSKQPPFPKRFGKPNEYARLAKDIIENPMINGTTIRLDAAMRMQPK